MDPSLRQRAATAALLAPLLLAIVGLGPIALEVSLLIVVSLVGREMAFLLDRIGFPAPPGGWILAPLLFLASLHLSIPLVWEVVALGAAALAMGWLFAGRAPRGRAAVFPALFAHLVGVLYAGLLPAYLCRLEAGPWPGTSAAEALGVRGVVLALLMTWSTDTGAYLAGTLFGRNKLWPEVSPSKTVEGAVGGVVLPVAVAVLGARWLAPGLSIPEAAILGLLVGRVAPLGDLFESRLKRQAGVKDSGRLLPGHGGLFDRFDSLFLAAPLFHYYLQAFGR